MGSVPEFDGRSVRGPVSVPSSARHYLSTRLCGICNSPLTVHEAVRAVCSRPECLRRLALRDATTRELERFERRRRIAAAAICKAESPDPAAVPEASVPVVVPVPVMPGRVVHLPARRRRAFLRRLIGVLREVWSEPGPVASVAATPSDGAPSDTAARARFLAVACATCRGSCCQVGVDHAFIDASVLRELRRREPDVPPIEWFSRYRRRLPEQAFNDSCVFHTRTGCALPRSLRSSICEQHLCRDLLRALEATPDVARRTVWLAAIPERASRPVRVQRLEPTDAPVAP